MHRLAVMPFRMKLLGLMALCALLITSCASGGSSTQASGKTPTVVLQSTPPLPTATTEIVTLPDNWKTISTIGPVAVPFAHRLAISTNNPLIGYACLTGSSFVGQIFSTGNSGATWQPLVTLNPDSPGSGGGCRDIAIDPTNPRDVVVAFSYPRSSSLDLRRSIDGGKTWRSLAFPQSPCNDFSGLTWFGNTLFVALQLSDGGSEPGCLFAVNPDNAMRLLTTNSPMSTLAGARYALTTLLTNSSAALYVQFTAIYGLPSPLTTLRSTDGGAHWTTFAPQDHGKAIDLVAIASDDRALLGNYHDRPNQPVISTDSGKTWQPFVLPLGANISSGLAWITPDGTIFLSNTSNNYQLIIKAPRSAPSGVLLLPVEIHTLSILTNPNGHPSLAIGIQIVGANAVLIGYALA